MQEFTFRAQAETLTFRIWMAGDYDDARRVLRGFCERGACFAIQPAEYVYTGGAEQGICVTLINYPRFPATEDVLSRLAFDAARELAVGLCQGSYSVEGPTGTYFFSRRDADQ